MAFGFALQPTGKEYFLPSRTVNYLSGDTKRNCCAIPYHVPDAVTFCAGKKSSFSLPPPLTAFTLTRCCDDGSLTPLRFFPPSTA
jgi:hypothetical protein